MTPAWKSAHAGALKHSSRAAIIARQGSIRRGSFFLIAPYIFLL
jgi:hypothetical protein